MDMKIEIMSGENVLEISPATPLRIPAGGLTGFDSVEIEMDAVASADGNGGNINGRRFCPRVLGIRLEIGTDTAEEDTLWRNKIRGAAQPTGECEITVDMGGVRRRIGPVYLNKMAFDRKTLRDKTEVTLQFTAPRPFFRAAEAVEENSITDTSFTITNTGEIPCGAVFTLRAVGGDVVNPMLFLGYNFIRLPVTVCDGDEAVIDTRWGQKGIWINGKPMFDFDPESHFFSLAVGENTINSEVSSGKEYMAVSWRYEPLYWGI